MTEEQETLSEFSEKVKEQVTDYVQVKMELLKAQWVEKIALVFSKMLTALVVMFLLFFSILFGSLVAGFYFGSLLGSMMLGFGMIALFYGVLLVLLYVYRKQWIETPVINTIISIIYQDTNENQGN